MVARDLPEKAEKVRNLKTSLNLVDVHDRVELMVLA